jgi:gamma-glutamyltranspeptidase/glutathione hydrolase
LRNLLITFLFVSSLNSTDYIDYLHPFHPTKSKEGMVVSQSALSSDIGVKILDMGGNAVDAAVAVGFSLAITLPRAGNLGGGGFMLIYLKERDEIFLYRLQKQISKKLINREITWNKKNTRKKF